MDPNARAKYLNSPETELFDKGRTLYNLGPAREAAGKGQPLVVAEGYMDVVALVSAGFEAAVAPLGTAVTEAQLQMLWRVHPEPVLALDGDRAGLRAAQRVVGLALPLLEPERTLRFALLPEGRDPDDLIRAEGAEAMRAALDGAQPLVRMLWRRETEGVALDTPERRAGLDRSLREAVRAIRDPLVRRHYIEELNRLRIELFGLAPVRDRPRGRDARSWDAGRGGARPSTRASVLVAQEDDPARLREAVILAVLLLHPDLFDEFEDRLEDVEFGGATVAMGRAVLRHRARRDACAAELGPGALETLLSHGHVRLSPAVRRPGDPELARACLEGELLKLAAREGLRREVEDATADLEALAGEVDDAAGEGMTWRLGQAAAALGEAERARNEDRTAFETAENGLALSRDERVRWRDLSAGIDFGRGGRAPRRRGDG